MTWTRGPNNVFRTPSLSTSPFFSSIFLSKFFPVFHSNSWNYPSRRKRKLHLLIISTKNTQLWVPLTRTRSHIHPCCEGKCSVEGHIGPTQTSWSESFLKEKLKCYYPNREQTQSSTKQDIHRIMATCLRMQRNLHMYNLVNIIEISNFPISFSLPFFSNRVARFYPVHYHPYRLLW